MVGKRCYRKAMSVPEAIAELRRVKGTQLDPELVERFIEIVENDNQHKQPLHLSTNRLYTSCRASDRCAGRGAWAVSVPDAPSFSQLRD